MKIQNGVLVNCSKKDVKFGRLSVPNEVEEIQANAFDDDVNISVIHTNNVKKIDDAVFENFDKLKKIVFSNSLTEIGSDTFRGCKKLKSAKLPKSLKQIGERSFSECTSLKKIDIPENITEIPDYAFKNCESLNSVTLPSNLKVIGRVSFGKCSNLKEIDIPDSIKEIKERAFSKCTSLQSVSIPESIKVLQENIFEGCSSLKNVTLPSSLISIKNETFELCQSLTTIKFPEKLQEIGSYAFSRCKNLENFVLPEGLIYIGEGAFNNCHQIQNVVIPKSINQISGYIFSGCRNLSSVSAEGVTLIKSHAFEGCTSLSDIKLSNEVKEIGDKAFSRCQKIVNFDFPKELTVIGDGSFMECNSLESVNLPEKLTEIGSKAFYSCPNLKSVSMSDNVTELGTRAFAHCESLKTVKLSNSLEDIDCYVFNSCKNLEEITIPSSVQRIGSYAFKDCEKLKNVKIQDGVKIIEDYAFNNCTSLTSIDIPASVEDLDLTSFSGCKNLREISVHSSIDLSVPINGISDYETERDFNYFTKIEGGYKLSRDPYPDSVNIAEIKANPVILSMSWDKKDAILKEYKNPIIKNFYDLFLKKLPKEQIKSFIENHNFTFYKQLPQSQYANENEVFYKFLYNLGAFNPPKDYNGKTINYSQKVGEFFREKISKNKINATFISAHFKNMSLDGFKKDFTDFFMSQFDALMEEESKSKGFIENCYNEFEKVQKTNTNNHGSQRQLKPTVDKFVKYFDFNKFEGITDETVHISRTISPYFSEQEAFEDAVEIEEERIKNGVKNNILNKPLKENPFDKIDDYSKKIQQTQGEILGNMAKIARKEFTWEWLEKNDPQNFILGKLCSCCAHLEGVGFGIMHASIVDPYVQNLVIRANNGEIIAKSTLYINPDQGYGVFNNVEVNEDVLEEDKELIYKKYIDGVKAFAEEYNKEHPNKPLVQINVGAHLNDLEEQLYDNNEIAMELLEAIDYGDYGKRYLDYSGDSDSGQFVVWRKEEQQKNELVKVDDSIELDK